MQRPFKMFWWLAGLLVVCGCGGGSSNNNNNSITGISISPTATTVRPGGVRSFSYQIKGTGSVDLSVLWSVNEAGGGTVDQNGNYTAPQTQGTYHVTVTSKADSSKSATAAVTVTTTGVSLAVINHIVSVAPGSTTSLASDVTVTGTTDTGLLWSVDPAGKGTIDANGNYTAPSAPGNNTVHVSSHADPTQTDVITVAVAQVTLTINPTMIPNANLSVLHVSQKVTFGYSINVLGSQNTSVTWATTDQNGNPINDGGAIDQMGNYTAPPTPGTYYVTVTSQAVPTVKATATIVVSP